MSLVPQAVEGVFSPQTVVSNDLGSTTVPKVRADVFVKTDSGYTLTPDSLRFLPESLAGAMRVLNGVAFEEFTNVESKIVLTSSRSLRKHFESGESAKPKILSILPPLDSFQIGDVVWFQDTIILLREEDYADHPSWRLIPQNGEALNEAELLILQEEFGLKPKVHEIESYAVPITVANLSNSRHAFNTIKTKIGNPKTTKLKKFLIPDTTVELHLRIHNGTRLWVALPENKVGLSLTERRAIQKFMGHQLKYHFKQVSADDIICSGPGTERYFRSRSDMQDSISSGKLDDPNTYGAETFAPKGKSWKPLVFEIKLNKDGEKVWTTPVNLYDIAAKYLGRIKSQCSYMKPLSSDAVVLTGKNAEIFWEGAGTDEFDQFIAREIIDPYTLNDRSIVFQNDFGSCEVFLGKINGEYFLWVERTAPNGRDNYELIARMLKLKPKEIATVSNDNDNTGGESVSDEDDLFSLVRRVARSSSHEPRTSPLLACVLGEERPLFEDPNAGKDDGTDSMDPSAFITRHVSMYKR